MVINYFPRLIVFNFLIVAYSLSYPYQFDSKDALQQLSLYSKNYSYFDLTYPCINNKRFEVEKNKLDKHIYFKTNVTQSVSVSFDISSLFRVCSQIFENRKKKKIYRYKIDEFITTYKNFSQSDFERKIIQEYYPFNPAQIKECSFGMYCTEHEKLFSEFHLYQFQGFQDYLLSFPCFANFIQDVNEKMHKDTAYHQLSKVLPGYSEKSFQTIVGDLHQKAQWDKQTNEIKEQQWIDLKAFEQDLRDEIQTVLDEPDPIIEKRLNALEAIKNNNSLTHKQYALSEKARLTLTKHNLSCRNFESCFGNELQQVVHEEFIDIINQAALLPAHEQIDVLHSLVVQFADIGLSCNQNNYIAKAFTIADFCWTTLNYCQAIGHGIIQGTQNTLNAIIHPIDTMQNMVHGISTIGYQFGKIIYNVYSSRFLLRIGYNPQETEKKLKGYYAHIHAVTNDMLATLAHIKGTQGAKELSAYATECVLTGKILTISSQFFTRAKGISATFIQKFGDAFENIPQQVVATPEGLTVGIASHAADTIKNFASNAGNTIKNKANGFIKYAKRTIDLSPVPKGYVDGLAPHIEKLKQMFDGTKFHIKDIGERILSIDYLHIFGIEIQEIIKKGKIKEVLQGFHLDPVSILKNKGVVAFENVKNGPCGSFMADVIIDGMKFEGKTFFPSDWTYEKCISKIIESTKDLIDKSVKDPKGRWEISGITSDGLKIRTIMDDSGKIITAYPIID